MRVGSEKPDLSGSDIVTKNKGSVVVLIEAAVAAHAGEESISLSCSWIGSVSLADIVSSKTLIQAKS